jgi:lectin, mannose-binding 1
VYTVDKFEGLVIVVDMHGGPAGGVRGFLNDGTVSFKNHHHLDTAAFGHCDVAYRNRGIPTRLQIKQDSTGFEVQVDDQRCFRSDKILLPPDYFLGLTGATSTTPDSFEIFKFITTTPSTSRGFQDRMSAQKPVQSRNDIKTDDKTVPELVQDVLASSISSSQAQFEDLHNRLQAQGHNIERLFSDYIQFSASMQGRIEELHSRLARYDQVRELDGKINNLEAELHAIRSELQKKDLTGEINDIHKSFKVRHDQMLQNLPDHIGHGKCSYESKV